MVLDPKLAKNGYANRVCIEFNYHRIFISWRLVSNGIRNLLAIRLDPGSKKKLFFLIRAGAN